MRFNEVKPLFLKYKILTDKNHILWCRAAWEALERQGIIKKQSKLMKSENIMVAHVIMILYMEFGQQMYEESVDYEMGYEIDDTFNVMDSLLDLSNKYVSKEVLEANKETYDDEIEWNDYGLYHALIEAFRGQVVKALINDYGKADLYIMLYFSWNSIYASDDDIEEDDYLREIIDPMTEQGYNRYREVIDEEGTRVVNCVSMNALCAYEWVCQEMQRISWLI